MDVPYANNINYWSSIFVSQNEQAYYAEVGCGVAALTVLLKRINLTPLSTQEELCNELRITVPPLAKGYSKDEPEIGLYPEDLFRYTIRKVLNFWMYFFEVEWAVPLQKAPIMVLMAGNEEEFGLNSHWIILVNVINRFFVYLDPWYKSDQNYIRHISIVDFRRYYTGIAL